MTDSNKPSSPSEGTANTELDKILRDFREVCFKVRDNKPSIDGLQTGITKAKADLEAWAAALEQEARIDELKTCLKNVPMPELSYEQVESRIAELQVQREEYHGRF